MLERSSVRCVLFDAVGTLIYPDPSVAAAYGSVASKHGSSLDEITIDERFRRAFRRQETIDAQPNGFLTDEARERRRWQTIVAEVFDDLPDASLIFSELWSHFAQPRHWRLFDEVPEVWHSLAARGVTLGIASNFDGRLHHVCAGLPPLDACERVFVSSEIGHRKPALEFFRQVENRLRIPASQIMLVGDDWSNDYRAAQSAGWQAVFINRCGADQADDAISSLMDLPFKLV